MHPSERRSYFRIDSEIILDFHLVDSYTVDNSSPEDEFPEDRATLELFAEFRRLEREASLQLKTISESNRALASYLNMLNKKLDLLAQRSISSEYSPKKLPRVPISLSEGGISFQSRKPVYKGSYVALKMLFVPDFIAVACFARVIRCDEVHDPKNHSELYQIGCQFIALENAKSDILGKQILLAQVKAKRQQKSSS